MVSRLPVFSGKRIGKRVPPDMVLPGDHRAGAVRRAADRLSVDVLTIGTLAYLASLPFGWLSYRSYERRAREGKAEAAPAGTGHAPIAASIVPVPVENEDRPSRLN